MRPFREHRILLAIAVVLFCGLSPVGAQELRAAGLSGAFTRAGVDFNVGIVGDQRMLAGGGQAKADEE